MRLRSGSFRTEPGVFYGTPKEIWGFRTPKRSGSAASIARKFLRANSRRLGLSAGLAGLEWRRTIRSLGATHVIFQQVLPNPGELQKGRRKHPAPIRIHRAYVTVHVGKDGGVYLVKNRAIPPALWPRKGSRWLPVSGAIARARRAVPGKRRATRQSEERLWFPKEDRLEPAWRVRLRATRPREDWIIHVNARTGGILSRHDNVAAARGIARVFDPSPVTALGGHEALLSARGRPLRPPGRAYVTVKLSGLRGNGRLEGRRVTTSPTAAAKRVKRKDHRFLFEARERGFEEAMVYHHIDSAIRYLEGLGFRGKRAIFTAPVEVDVNGSREDNSWYSPVQQRITFGTGEIDDAEDAETILHELGHAIQDAIIPDFGQSEEAAAIGEGFGDYFAASFFADRKPERYRPCVMTWDGLFWGLDRIRDEDLDPPACLRRVDHDWTFDDWDPEGEEHENGEIWSATLWEIRGLLGRERADRLILESHFQLDGFTTFARAARAIVDADRNLNGGANRERLRAIFRRRRIGPV